MSVKPPEEFNTTIAQDEICVSAKESFNFSGDMTMHQSDNQQLQMVGIMKTRACHVIVNGIHCPDPMNCPGSQQQSLCPLLSSYTSSKKRKYKSMRSKRNTFEERYRTFWTKTQKVFERKLLKPNI